MKSFIEHMSSYAKYHRDPRNILTHLIGVPVIVFSVILLLSRPTFEVLGMNLTPVLIAYILAMVFYFKLNILFGSIMALLMGAGLYAAQYIANISTLVWLTTGIALFVVGWGIQFLGHHYEGKKPAFVDDLVGLLIGPLFVTAEILFALGLCSELKADIEARAGKVKHNSVEVGAIVK